MDDETNQKRLSNTKQFYDFRENLATSNWKIEVHIVKTNNGLSSWKS